MRAGLGDRRAKRLLVAVLAVIMAVPALVWSAWPSAATASFAVSRIGGPDRYDTARQVAERAFPSGAATVILANGLNYPDALAGAYLAGTKNVPILLTNPDSLSAAAAQALRELKTKNVTVLGGNLAISDNVVNQLTGMASTSTQGGNIAPSRLFGPTRYETAASIATSGGTIGTVDGVPTALVASGNNFPDALSAGPASFAAHLPILLTDKDTESPQTEAALTNLGIKQVILLGGTLAVSAGVAASLASNGRTVTRIGGQDRTDTAAQFYEQIGLKKLGFSDKVVFLANGITFPAPDALAGSPLAGKTPTAILLTSDADNLGQYTANDVQSHSATLTGGTILGQTAAISAAGQAAFVQAAGGASNVNGPIMLDKTTVAPGGAITGAVSSPATVSSIIVNGCGLDNQAVSFGTSGAFSVTIPANQPGGLCSLTFTVNHNDGSPADSPSFSISVTNPTLSFNAPALASVAVTRGVPPTTFDTAVFTFSEPLATLLPNPANFQLYRASGAFATGIGAPVLNANAWTIQFPAGSVTNATLGGVVGGAVTNTSGQPNFPGSVAVSGTSSVPLTTLEPDLSTVSAPAEDASNRFLTSVFGFDKSFVTTAFPSVAAAPLTSGNLTLNAFTTVVPGTALTGNVTDPAVTGLTVAGCTIAPAQTVTLDGSRNFSVTIPAAQARSANPNDPANGGVNACTLTFVESKGAVAQPAQTVKVPQVDYIYCVPALVGGMPKDSAWELVGAAGAKVAPTTSTAQTATSGAFASVSAGTIPQGGACAAASSATMTVTKGTAANLNIVSGDVSNGAVFTSTNDGVGNPLESAFVPTSTTSTWPVLNQAVEARGSGTSTKVTFFFRSPIAMPGAFTNSDFRVIEGDGTEVSASAVSLGPGTTPSTVIATFTSFPGIADAVGASVRNHGPCDVGATSGCAVLSSANPLAFYANSSVPLTGSGTSTGGQVVLPQLLKVDMSTTQLGTSVVFTFDKPLVAAPTGDFLLYNTNGGSNTSSSAGTIDTGAHTTVTFTSNLLGGGFGAAVINAAVAGGVFDHSAQDPSLYPPGSVQATINGQLAGTTTTTSTTSTTVH